MSENDKFMCICLKKKITATEWIQTNRRTDGCNFQATVEYQPQLQQQRYIGSDKDCYVFQPNITFDFFASVTSEVSEDSVDHSHIRIWYDPESDLENHEFTKSWIEKHKPNDQQNKCGKSECTSYIWCLDNCLIKMTFHNAADPESSGFTKRFHLEHENNFNFKPSFQRFPDFFAQRSVSMKEFKKEVGYLFSNGVESFAPVDIEIRARLYLFPVLFGNHYNRFDPQMKNSKCSLGSTLLLSQESNQMQSISQLFVHHSKSKHDVCFVIGSGPQPKTLAAHSWILSAHSPVFRSILSSEMTERASRIIKLSDDVNLETFELFLGLVYEVSGFYFGSKPKSSDPWDVEKFLGVLKLAHEYQFENIFEFCLDIIIGLPHLKFDFQAAVSILKAGHLYEVKDLEYRSAQWFKKQLKSADVKKVLKQLKELLKEEKNEKIIDFFVDNLLLH